MAKSKNMADMLSKFEIEASEDHDSKEAHVKSEPPMKNNSVAQITMPKEFKARATKIARAHGLSLSALVRLSIDEYFTTHNWI